ncbi:MAG: hypothetical protein ABSF25_01645 [Bryobacteraceae bacterium]|jgi:hypothetical protein
MNFRRWITALAVVTLFVGLAAAQTSGGGTALTCNTVAQVTPTIRSEGLTEEVGDIVITCQGGTYVALNTAIPQGNIVISLTAPVTSRLASGSAPAGAAGQPSEAILMVDEPNSGLAGPVPGFGPGASLSVCPTPGTGCTEYATSVAGTGGNYVVATNAQNPGTPAPGYNVFQGNVSGNTVSFQGIPFLPPVTNGVVRVYRITNIRVNATGAGSSVVSGVQPVYAYISTNGASTLPINSANGITVGFVSTSLNPSVTNAKTAFTQCLGQTQATVATLNFADTFPSAFKTRIAPFGTTGTSYIGTSSAAAYPQQSIPGQLYGSESNFILPVNGVQAGLADFGTRFQAVFNNLPSGATIYVSPINTNAGTGVQGGYNIVEPAIALLTTGGATGVFTAPSNPTANFPLTPVSGSATAVWEVVNNNTSANVNFQFGVYITYATNNPPVPASTGSPTVTLSYAPISSTGSASSSANIPRFILGANSTAQAINVTVGPCQTLLLFPYVTSQGGFDTGIAISNTSMDPWGTATSSGTCSLYFYGQNQLTAPLVVGPIAPGNPNPALSAFTTSSVAPNFEGYVIAVCNFQFAHGFAFVSDIGARNLAMGYLPLIITNGATQQNFRGNGANVGAEILEN